MNPLRIVLAVAGLVFAVAGIATDNRIVIWAAIGLLAVSFAIRLTLRRMGRNQ
ncbi:MAG: hypothetical protein ACREL6_13290 [Gemmatimonadales bacterium]